MSLIRYVINGAPTRVARFGWLDDRGKIQQVGQDEVDLPQLLVTSGTIDALRDAAHGRQLSLDDVTLGCPIPAPRRVLAAAGNYIPEGRAALGPAAQPWLFSKMADAPLGPGDAIPLPSLAGDVVEEIELALVIGRPGRDIPVDEADAHVAGWTICNDVSARRLNLETDRRPGKFAPFFDWLNGKWFDGFLSLGPRIVGPAAIGDIRELTITTRVNGEVRVTGSVSTMTFSPYELIAFASRIMELRSGDVIATGMPHGGVPEIYLQPGDRVDGEISRIGVLTNHATNGMEAGQAYGT